MLAGMGAAVALGESRWPRCLPEKSRVAVKAVFRTLGKAVTGGEFKDVMCQPPGEFAELVKR
jgi:hypothetical protein